MDGSQYDHLTYDELRNLRKSRGYCEKDTDIVEDAFGSHGYSGKEFVTIADG